MRKTNYRRLTDDQRRLVDEASRVMETAYNPYSHFCVGAALLSEDGSLISASNVENAAYGSTMCAERIAIGKANSLPKRKLHSIAIIGRGLGFEAKQVVSPCGACRQMLYEASDVAEVDLEVVMCNTTKAKILISTINELLPLAFGPSALNIDVKPWRI